METGFPDSNVNDRRRLVEDLLRERADLVAQQVSIKGLISEINDRLTEIVGPDIEAEFERQAKSFGQVTFETSDGLKVKGEIAKKVKWDSDRLMAAARGLPWDAVQRLFKITFSMPEKVYGDLVTEASAADESDPAAQLVRNLTEARTVEIGAPAIKNLEVGHAA